MEIALDTGIALNKTTSVIHILCKHKLLFWMRLIAINRFTVPNFTF